MIFLVDVSASVAQDNHQEIFDFINGETANAGARDYIGVIAFAREPSVELAGCSSPESNESDSANIGGKPYNSFGNPFKRQNGTDDNNVWQNPTAAGEASTYYLSSNARATLSAFDAIFSRAAVSGSINAALRVRTIRMPEHCCEQVVGVARVNGERRNLPAVAQAQVRPGLARIHGFVDAVAH